MFILFVQSLINLSQRKLLNTYYVHTSNKYFRCTLFQVVDNE